MVYRGWGRVVILVAAAVTVPQVVNLPMLGENPTSGPVAGAGHSTSPTPARRPSSVTASAAVSGASLIPPVPVDFRPTSVTFVGPHTGWVIGQAGDARALRHPVLHLGGPHRRRREDLVRVPSSADRRAGRGDRGGPDVSSKRGSVSSEASSIWVRRGAGGEGDLGHGNSCQQVSIDRDVGRRRELRPLAVLGRHERPELGWRISLGDRAQRLQPLLHVGRLHAVVDRRIELVDDRGRGSGRRHHAIERRDLVVRHPGLDHRWQVRGERRAGVAGHRERAQPAVAGCAAAGW